MSRKCISRSLPPLAEVFSSDLGVSESDNKQRFLLLALRKAAKQLKKRKSQPFYSMREVAAFFKSPLRTVAKAYAVLEHEGLLNRVRSSQTLLLGSADSTQHIIRGVVGIPLWLHAIVVSPFSRSFNMELIDRLRQNGFVAHIIFFRTGEECKPDFGERLLLYDLDFLIWHAPHSQAVQACLFMQDHGVRLINVQMVESPTSQIPPTYLMDWQPAYRQMAKAWQEAGINRVLIPKPESLLPQQVLQNFCKLLETHGMEPKLTEPDASVLLRESTGRGSAVAFLDQFSTELVCNQEPTLFEQIVKVSRVAFCRGPIRLPYFQKRPMRADIIGFAAIEMADHIVSGICNPPSREIRAPHCFKATYYPQAMLNDIKEWL